MGGVSGEIASLFVRLRPSFSGFAAETTEGIKGALADVQAEVASSARANIAQSKVELEANRQLAASYREIGAQAAAGSDEARLAAKMAADADRAAASAVIATADEQVAAITRVVEEARISAAEYKEIGAAAAKGSDEAVIAARLAADAQKTVNEQLGIGIEESAAKGSAALSGLRHRFLSFGNILGVAFGGYFAVKFAKDVSGVAASVQNATKVVQEEFGKSTAIIQSFVKSSATGLHITGDAALTTAANFGVVFKNLGIGQNAAAQMTVGWEKLVGAIAKTKGVDPTSILQRIQLAAEGNARGLKQLGITESSATQEAQAFRDGLTQTINTALTPAQKAIVTYQLALSHLPDFLKSASRNSGDYANQVLALSTAWGNAKEAIGAAVLPLFTRLVGFLASIIPNAVTATKSAVTGLTAAFHAIGSVVGPVVGWLNQFHGLIPALVAGLGAMTVAVIALGVATKVWEGIQEILNAELLANPIGITITAIAALSAAIYELYTHNEAFRQDVQKVWSSIRVYVIGALNDIRDAIHNFVGDVETFWSEWGSTITSILQNTWTFVKQTIQNDLQIIEGFVDVFKGVFEGKWGEVWKGLKKIATGGLDQVKDYFEFWGKDILAILEGIWQKIEIVFINGVNSALKPLGSIIGAFTGLLGDIGIHVSNPVQDLQNRLKALTAGITAAAAARQAASSASSRAQTFARDRTIDPSGSEATTQVATSLNSPAGKAKVKAAADQLGKNTRVAVVDSLQKQLKQQELSDAVANSIFNNGIATGIANAKGRVANAIATGNQRIAAAVQSYNNYIKTEANSINTWLLSADQTTSDLIKSNAEKLSKLNETDATKLQTIANQAANNLTSIGKKLNSALGTLIDKNIALGTTPANAALSAATMRLQESLLGGAAGSNPAKLRMEAQALTTAVNVKGNTAALKQTVEAHVSALLDAAQKGKIGVKQLMTDLTGYLRSQGITFKSAGHVLGSAFAQGLQADLTGIQQQFAAILAEPSKARAAARAATLGGSGIKIVDYATEAAKLHKELVQTQDEGKTRLKELRERDARDLKHRLQEVAAGEKERKTRIADAREAKAKSVDAARTRLDQLQQTDALKVAKQHYQESIKQTSLLKRIAAATAASAKNNSALAATVGSSTGFKTSTTANPGRAAHDARQSAGKKG